MDTGGKYQSLDIAFWVIMGIEGVISTCKEGESIAWEKTIELIEVYRMTQKLEHPWVSEVLNKDEIKQFAEFEASLKKRGANEAERFKTSWVALMAEIESRLNEDPRSQTGIDIGKRCMEMVNAHYGKEHINLRKKIWENGFMNESKRMSHGLSKEVTSWLETAVDAYWHDRAYTILNQIDSAPEKQSLNDWNQLLEDMYGTDENRKTQLLDVALNDENICENEKKWLVKNYA